MESYIDKLRELTGKLPPVHSYVESASGFNVTYKIQGNCFGSGLMKRDEVAVQTAFMSRGSVFPDHAHGEVEIIVVWKGDLYYKTLSKEGVLRPGETIIFPANELHSVTAFTDVNMIGITIPASEIYPEAGALNAERKP
jgi:quercetin dioxygenase-like cupin family protein